jgi:hypothetical protein
MDIYNHNQSQSNFTTDGQSVSPSWCSAPLGTHGQFFPLCFSSGYYGPCPSGAPSLASGRFCNLSRVSVFVVVVQYTQSYIQISTICIYTVNYVCAVHTIYK